MNDRDVIIAKIKESAYENVNKKLEEERKKIENKVNNELKDVERCLQYINNKMVFKIIKSNWSHIGTYVLADENTFFEDYNREPKYSFDKGIKFADSNSKSYESLFKVNGESYYDMRYIIRNYDEKFNVYSRRLSNLHEQFNKIEEAVNDLKRQEPCIKKLIEQYKKVEIDESYLKEIDEDDWLSGL